MEMYKRCIQLVVISAALAVSTLTGALSHLQPEGDNQLYQTPTKIPEPADEGTTPGGPGLNVVACATAISAGLFVGILAVTLLVITAVLVRRRSMVIEWKRLKNVQSTEEFRADEDKDPLSQINGSCGGDEHSKNITT